MTIKELKQHLENDSLTDEQRGTYLRSLMKILTPLSVNELLQYQQQNMGQGKPWEEYRKGQNAVMLQCIGLELHDLGKEVRSALQLPPLTEDTEL